MGACFVLILLLAATACAQPAPTPLPEPPALPEIAPPCPVPQLPDEAGRCTDAESAVTGPGGRTLWVAPTGSDAATGSRETPLRTIQAAADRARPGDGILIREGVYRETVRPRTGGDGPGRRVTFAAYPGETVVVSGSELLPGPWTETPEGWRTAWPRELPAYVGDLGDALRRELVTADGTVLRPDFDSGTGRLAPDAFRPEGPDTAVRALIVGVNPATAHLEAAERTVLFAPLDLANPYADCGSAGQPAWLRLVGLTFRHAANRAQWGAVCLGRSDALVEDVTVEWTNGLGIDTSGERHVVRRTRANDNGQMGWGGSCSGCLFEDTEAARNNWRGVDAYWEAGGGKWTHSSGSTWRRHRATDNDGPGLWLDIDNHGNRIEDALLVGNMGAGLILELNTTETVVERAYVAGTRRLGWSGTGVLMQAASRNTLRESVIVGNEGGGLWLRLDPEGRAQDGHHRIERNLVAGNLTDATFEAREVAVEDETLDAVRSNRFSGNRWGRVPASGERSTFFVRPEPGNPAHHRSSDLARWAELVGAEGDGWAF